MNHPTPSLSIRKLHLPRIAELLSCIALAATAQAQTLPKVAETEETITLPTFSVESRADDGYASTDSITASRVATKNKDLPYNINVVTREFINDFAASELEEQFAYTSSFAPSEVPGEYTLRGIVNTKQLRNGFTRLGLNDRVNIARAEVIKGPVAAIYGQTQPGGLINIVTEKPKEKHSDQVEIGVGEYNYLRAEISSTGPLVFNKNKKPKTFYLISAAHSERDYEQDFRHTESQVYYGVLTHKFSENTNLTFDLEYLKRNSQRGNPLPFTIVRKTITAITPAGLVVNDTFDSNPDLAWELAKFSWDGPSAFTNRDLVTAQLTFEHKFNHIFSLRAALNGFDRHYYNTDYTGNAVNLTTRLTSARAPRYNVAPQWTTGAQVDMLAHYRFAGAEMRTLLTFDYMDQNSGAGGTWERRLATRLDAQFNVRFQNIDAPNYYLHPFSFADYDRLQASSETFIDATGVFLRQQASFGGGKVIAMAGLRYDYVNYDLRDHVANKADVYSADALTSQAGVNIRLNKQATFYANRSESFNPQTSLGTNGERLDNETGIGYESGFKVDLFDEQLNFTTSYFWIERRGVRSTELEEVVGPGGVVTTQSVTRTLGTTRSQGVELDLNFRSSKALQLIGGIGYVDSQVVWAGKDLDAIGRPPGKTPEMTYGFAVKYTVEQLKGLSFSGGVKYVGETFLVNPTTGARDSDRDGFTEAGEHNGQRDVQIPDYTLVDLGARYAWWGASKRLRHQVQINLKNVLDKKYVDSSAFAGDRRSVTASYSLRF